MKRFIASFALGFACLAVCTARVAADGTTNSDPFDPPGGTTQTQLEGVVIDVLLDSWSVLWSVIV